MHQLSRSNLVRSYLSEQLPAPELKMVEAHWPQQNHWAREKSHIERMILFLQISKSDFHTDLFSPALAAIGH